jgi:hypothetical protein
MAMESRAGKSIRTTFFFGNCFVNVLHDLSPNILFRLRLVLKYSTFTLFPYLPKEETLKEDPNVMQQQIVEESVAPRGSSGYNRV